MDMMDPTMGQTPEAHTRGTKTPPFPRWVLKKLNNDALLAASTAKSWEQWPPISGQVADEAKWFKAAWTQISDAAMPRARAPPRKKAAY